MSDDDVGRDSIDRLVEWLAGRPPNRSDEDVDEAWVARLVELSRAVPMPEPPVALAADLRAIFRDRHWLTAGRPSHMATVVVDSRMAAATGSTRGAETGAGWSLVLSAGVADVVVDVAERGGGDITLRGQVLARDGGRPQLTGSVLTEIDGPASRGTIAKDRFRFDGVTTTRSLLSVATPAWELRAVLDLGPGHG